MFTRMKKKGRTLRQIIPDFLPERVFVDLSKYDGGYCHYYYYILHLNENENVMQC